MATRRRPLAPLGLLALAASAPGALAERTPAVPRAALLPTEGRAALPRSFPHEPPSARRCGCARPRLLRDGKEAVLDEGRGLAAWLAAEGRARFTTFERAPDGSLRSTAPPVAEEAFELSAFEGAGPGRARLVRLYATGPERAPFFVGVLQPPAKTPIDVVEARIELTAARAASPPPGMPAHLVALHLGPLEEHRSPGCGGYLTHRAAFAPVEGTSDPAGFLVTVRPAAGLARTALVDVRHARTFGFGRVEPCDHGAPFVLGEAAELSVRTVSRDFALGPAWRWSLAGEAGGPPPPALQIPEHAAPERVDDPFVPGYRTPIERLLSDDTDHAALGVMVLLVSAAVALASVFWGARRRRRRQIVEVTCPACQRPLSLDLADPATDGLFCPTCGGSSVFVTFEADGTPRCRVLRLGEPASG